ncbi:MAG: GyrI-like domain-containing protein [Alphaproteobacteria bacterium]|nr:GyrI-like domain-containing protein [Alphaproteobacteria bacterium]
MSRTTIVGIQSFTKLFFIGIENHQSMPEKFNNVINENYTKLENLVKKGALAIKQSSFSAATLCIYHSVNPTEPYMAAFANAIEIDPQASKRENIEALLDGDKTILAGTIPDQKFMLKVIHEGSHESLGSSWQAADAYLKEKGLVRDSGYSPFERYVVISGDSSITEIYIPLLADKR